MTVKEMYEYYPNSTFFVQGFGGYPMRHYPSEFTTRERKKLANMEVKTAREIDGKGYFYRYGSNTIVVTVERGKNFF